MKLLVHVEQYNVLGILPSQLESLSLLATAMGMSEAAYVDGTRDGFAGVGGFTRYPTMAAFFENQSGPFVAFSPDEGDDIRRLTVPVDSWLLFGPSMGWGDLLNNHPITWAKIPGGVLNSRDAAPIAVWELSSWQEQ